jgi:hypothetical protein
MAAISTGIGGHSPPCVRIKALNYFVFVADNYLGSYYWSYFPTALEADWRGQWRTLCRASLSCACIREPSNENNLYILAVLFFEGGGFDLSASPAIIPQDDLFESPSRIVAFQASQAIINLPHGLLFEPRQTLFEFRRFERINPPSPGLQF